MYREPLNLLFFLLGLMLAFSIAPAFADPATEETLVQLESTVSQNSMLLMIIAHVVVLVLGFMAGQQR